jgi:hypothetical protein
MKILQIDSDAVKLISELREIRERLKADKKQEETLCESIKTLAENQPASLKFRQQIMAQIEEGSTTSIDSKALRAAHPEIAQQFTRTINYLKVKPC